LVLCSGKVYYDLFNKLKKDPNDDVAVARVEQLYPFPNKDIATALEEYTNLEEIVWCQEEPKNMGAWTFAAPRLRELMGNNINLRYAGRQASASPAAGQKKVHQAEQDKLVEEAVG